MDMLDREHQVWLAAYNDAAMRYLQENFSDDLVEIEKDAFKHADNAVKEYLKTTKF